MNYLVFLLEEPSAQAMLEGILPRLLPPHQFHWQFLVFEGKQDLEKQMEKKLRGWLLPNSFFIVLRDQDAGDCIRIKQKLVEKCRNAGKPTTLVRIACHELESWFLGDLAAVQKAFNIKKLAEQQRNRKYKEPDKLSNASEELEKLVKGYRKVSGAKKIAAYMAIDQNYSHSFNCFISGVNSLVKQS